MKTSWCVYKHTLLSDGRVYIGQTNNIKNRWKPSAYKNCVKFYNAINNYGWDSFSHEIIKDNLTIEEANYYEEYYIKEYNSIENGFNLNCGGNNKLFSKETIEKMSKTRKGVKFSEEHKNNISKALKKYVRTNEHNENNRLAQHGKKVQCIETGKIYDSINLAGRETKIFGKTISLVYRGLGHTAGGFHWRFVDD